MLAEAMARRMGNRPVCESGHHDETWSEAFYVHLKHIPFASNAMDIPLHSVQITPGDESIQMPNSNA